jgi:carbamoyltransferase
MIILGINFSHDSSVAIIKNGKIVAAIEEEKTSRIKQRFGWPHTALEVLLKHNNIKKDEVDVIAFGSLFYNELAKNEISYRFLGSKAYRRKEIFNRVLSYYVAPVQQFGERNKKVFEKMVRGLGYRKAKVKFYNHHLSHAASAYYAAPFESDMIITCDGHGDGESFNFYTFNNKQGITPLKINDYKVSIGQFYSAITKLLGFRPTRHEGKITGLAAYGKHTHLIEDFSAFFAYDSKNNLIRYPFENEDAIWKQNRMDKNLTLANRINMRTSESAVGMQYAKRAEILLQRIKELAEGHTKEDIAYACQYVTEKVVLEEIKNVIKNNSSKKTGLKISLAGGVFANVKLNQRIYEMAEVDNVFVQPAMGDSGLAMGAAMLADIQENKKDINTRDYVYSDTYWGPAYDDEIEGFLQQIAGEATVVKMEQPAKQIAQLLKDNQVVGFWHGHMEWGPRALGKRSMILNTFDKTVNDSVNKRLSRTEFMPFAPSIIDYKVKTYIPAYDESCPAGDYMTITYDVDKQYHEELQAVVHVDGTARPHVVTKESNAYYYDIIDEFHKLTGCGAIVNTSFNAHEEPIVSTPAVAYKALKEDRIDVLVLEQYLISIKR